MAVNKAFEREEDVADPPPETEEKDSNDWEGDEQGRGRGRRDNNNLGEKGTREKSIFVHILDELTFIVS